MASKGNARLNSTAVKLGTALGRADRGAREIAKSARSSADELRRDLMDLTEAADRLARDLRKASAQLRKVLR